MSLKLTKDLDKQIDREIIGQVIIDLVKGYSDYDEFIADLFYTEDYNTALEHAVRWAIDYRNKYLKE